MNQKAGAFAEIGKFRLCTVGVTLVVVTQSARGADGPRAVCVLSRCHPVDCYVMSIVSIRLLAYSIY